MMREPVAYAELRSDLIRGHRWHVAACPFSDCGREHEYAAGGPGEDPRRHLGLRLSNCPRARWFALEERTP